MYVVLCVIVPALWGVVAYVVFGAIDRRRNKPEAGGTAEADGGRPPPIDYYI